MKAGAEEMGIPRGTVARLLATAFMLTCLGYAWSFDRYSCKVFSFLWEEHGFSEAFAGQVESFLIGSLLMAAVCIWFGRLRWIAVIGSAALISEMLAETFMPSAKYPMLYWAEWTLRYSIPVLLLVMVGSRAIWEAWGDRLMGGAIALVFAAHGLKALQSDPQFVDYILVTCRRLGTPIAESHAVAALHVIGFADLLAAVLLLFLTRERKGTLLLWMALWGLVTALSRLTYGGLGNGYEVLVRSSHFLVPVALWLDLRSRRAGLGAAEGDDPKAEREMRAGAGGELARSKPN